MRLLLLTLASGVLFVGFAVPFFANGILGILLGFAAIAIGAALIWLVESKTRKALEADTAWNRLMRADGENLVDRPSANDD